ncbi:MAG: RNA polymerase sigma factor [Bacteroidota bacterium]
MTNLDINSIVQKVKQGDENAFEVLYDNYSSALFGVCLKIVNDQAVAEDVLQDAYLKIWSNIQSYDSSKGSIFTWMLNIARNSAIDKYRQQKKRNGSAIQNSANDVSNLLSNSEENNINTIGLNELIQKLPVEQQEIIEYLYFRGYTQQELADELNIPLGTVKTRSRAALKILRDLFVLLIASWIVKNT